MNSKNNVSETGRISLNCTVSQKSKTFSAYCKMFNIIMEFVNVYDNYGKSFGIQYSDEFLLETGNIFV